MDLQDRWSLMAVVSQDRFHCTVSVVSVIVSMLYLLANE